MNQVRKAAVAGMFYPADPGELRGAIDSAFRDAVPAQPGAHVPEAVIVPHAGYPYSGAIAASAYARILPARHAISRIVVLGPSHHAHIEGLAVPTSDAFETPLGRVPIDHEMRHAVGGVPGVTEDDRPHRDEHSLEVQLPFLQHLMDRFTLLPLAVGGAAPEEVAAALEMVWGGASTLVVISTDLSHYLPYHEAVQRDALTASAIEACRWDSIADHDACGARPLRGLLHLAHARSLAVERLDLRNSGDTAGDRSRVVGYGAFAVG